MIALRRLALGVLWLLAAVGIACGLIWGATAAGLIKPLIVISGSMEPHIMTGDLLVDRPVSTGTLRPGDVVSLPNALTHDLVTHRIQTVSADGNGTYTITLKGETTRSRTRCPTASGPGCGCRRCSFPVRAPHCSASRRPASSSRSSRDWPACWDWSG